MNFDRFVEYYPSVRHLEVSYSFQRTLQAHSSQAITPGTLKSGGGGGGICIAVYISINVIVADK